jgi:hypothetical protein
MYHISCATDEDQSRILTCSGSGPSGIEAFSDKMGDISAEAHQQLAGSSDEPVTPSKGSIDSNDSRTGQQQTDPAITSIDNADSHREEKTVRKRK